MAWAGRSAEGSSSGSRGGSLGRGLGGRTGGGSSSRSSRYSRHALVSYSTESSEPSTPTQKVVNFMNVSSDSSDQSPPPAHKVVSFVQGLAERRPSSSYGRRESLAQALENSIMRHRGQYGRRSSVRSESSFFATCSRCFPCTIASGYR